MTGDRNNNIDDLLQELKSQYKSSDLAKPEESNNREIDNLIDSVKSEVKTNKSKSKPKNSEADNFLASIKTQHQNKNKQIKAQTESVLGKNRDEIIIQEQQKQLRQKLLTKQAEQWLLKLDPNSTEGMWFEELAASYNSRLEAAIDYLSALNK